MPGVGRGVSRGREGQMALPMQAQHAAQHPGAGLGQAAPVVAANPTPRGGYAAPVPRPQPMDPTPESINLDDFYANMEQVPPAAMTTGATPPPMPAAQPTAEWTPAERAERPIIRPQASGAPAPLARRAAAQVQSPRPADELGVEESEFDKPTYLRRGLYAPE